MPILTLELPLPDSPNRAPAHHMARHRWKRAYQRAAWIAAVAAAKPLRDPPPFVRVTAHMRVHIPRDDDNKHASLKFVLDALRQSQKSRKWRGGLYSECGYFVDDDPKHLELVNVSQEVNRKDKGLMLVLEWGE